MSPGAVQSQADPRAVSFSAVQGVHSEMAIPLGSEAGPVVREAALPVDASFEDFFDAERVRLFGVLALMSRNRAEAEEVMQDAFLKVWERWDRVSTMESPAGFLYRTALNLYRKRLRRAAVALRKATQLLPGDDPLEEVEARDEIARLLGGLTVREREAIVLTSYLGYPAEEAGRLLGIRASTVRVLTTRARASIRRTSERRQP